MHLSNGLITRIVDEERIKEVVSSGIDGNFLDEDYIPVFNYVHRHSTEYGSVPSRDALQKAFPAFEFQDTKEPLEYFIRELQVSRRRAILEDQLQKAVRLYSEDPAAAEDVLKQTLQKLHLTQKSFRDLVVAEHAEEAYGEYLKRKEKPGATGILSGWSKLDYQTLGWQPEEFAVLVGEKYMGKSWLMIWLAYQAAKQGKRVLYVTKEMSPAATERRLHSIYAGVKFDRLRRGELEADEEVVYLNAIKKLTKQNFHFIVARAGVTSVADIKNKAMEMDADIIFGDSIYLFPPTNDYRQTSEPQKRKDISTSCKEIAQTLGIPFIVSVQAGRKKTKERTPDLDDIEWSNAFSQDADTVFFLDKDDIDIELNRAWIHLLKSRDGDKELFCINTNFNKMQFDQADVNVAPTTDVFEDSDNVFS